MACNFLSTDLVWSDTPFIWMIAFLQYLNIYLTRVDSLRRRMPTGLDFELIRQTFVVRSLRASCVHAFYFICTRVSYYFCFEGELTLSI